MAKISPVSGKYIIKATIHIDGVVDRPDIIGAIFGQTEGLLGAQLELRELQKSGRIGRIEVTTKSKGGKTDGDITIPSSLDKAETAIVGAALEIIERIGPCNSNIKVTSIEDIRIAKRDQVIKRAKQLLSQMQTKILPDSQEIAEAVADSVRVMDIETYGPEKLPCGPAVKEGEEIIVVEGRADVVNLLKHGFTNAIAMNGANVPKTLAELCKKKKVTVFVDGDRGGILNIKELIAVTDIDFIARAPDGKEVEELTQKEIHKALRATLTPDQMKGELASRDNLRANARSSDRNARSNDRNSRNMRDDRREKREPRAAKEATKEQMAKFQEVHEDLIGSHAAALLDKNMDILGRVPVAELASTIEGADGVFAVAVDGAADAEVVKQAEKTRVKFVVASESKAKSTRVGIVIIE